MGKIKKIGIGFGVVILSFFVLAIIVGVTYDRSDNAEPQEEINRPETISKESESFQPATIGGMPVEPRISYRIPEDDTIKQEETYFDPNPVMKEYRERQAELETIQGRTELKDEKLSAKDLQTIVAGFESYNKSVKILLDACVAVESEEDFVALGQLVAESGEEFLEVTSGFGAVRNKLMDEGYGDHPELGPLMNQSALLVDGMSMCMEVLAWEFSG